MSQTKTQCGVCQTNFRRISFRMECPHCKKTVCSKCSKGPICIECFDAAPAELQTSGVRVNRKIGVAILIPLGLIIFPFVFFALSGLFHFEVSADYSFFILIMIIGFVGLILAGLYSKTSSEKWYQVNHTHLLPKDGLATQPAISDQKPLQ